MVFHKTIQGVLAVLAAIQLGDCESSLGKYRFRLLELSNRVKL